MVQIEGREYCTPPEAAMIIGCTPAHVRYLLRTGRLTGYQLGRQRYALVSAARAYAVHQNGLIGDGRSRSREGKISAST